MARPGPRREHGHRPATGALRLALPDWMSRTCDLDEVAAVSEQQTQRKRGGSTSGNAAPRRIAAA
jgi:hypothetical protein